MSNEKHAWSKTLPFQVLIALMLFFGHLRTSMNHNEFVSAMGLIGVFGAIHMFSWLVVFQFRKNLMEEQRLMARLVASAPIPPGKKIVQFPQKFHDLTYLIFFSLEIFQMIHQHVKKSIHRHHHRMMKWPKLFQKLAYLTLSWILAVLNPRPIMKLP